MNFHFFLGFKKISSLNLIKIIQLMIILSWKINLIFRFASNNNYSNTNILNSNTKLKTNWNIAIFVNFTSFLKKIYKNWTLTQNIIYTCVREIVNCVRDL